MQIFCPCVYVLIILLFFFFGGLAVKSEGLETVNQAKGCARAFPVHISLYEMLDAMLGGISRP